MHFTLCDMVADLAQNAVESGAEHISVAIEQTKAFFVFCIRDDGRGIAAERTRTLADPFHTDGEKHPSRRVSLGIPFLAQTAEATGGSWSITSEPGKGTEVLGKIGLASVDAPPAGSIAGLVRTLVSMPDMRGGRKSCDVEVSRAYRETPGHGERRYTVRRSELRRRFGELDSAESLALAGKYIASQEHEHKELLMAKMTLEDLRGIRSQMKPELMKREPEGKKFQIIVGMGTCGISAGAKATLDAFIEELDARGMGALASVRQSGCMEKCDSEPTVEVIAEGMPTVIYGKVTPAVAKDIVQSHLVDKKLLDNLVIEKR